jgi:hypothetical protein
MTTELSPETLERIKYFQAVYEELETFMAYLPQEEREIVTRFDWRDLILEAQDTEELPVITDDIVADMPVASDLVPEDSSVPVDEAATFASAPSSAKKEGRGRPRKTVQ